MTIRALRTNLKNALAAERIATRDYLAARKAGDAARAHDERLYSAWRDSHDAYAADGVAREASRAARLAAEDARRAERDTWAVLVQAGFAVTRARQALTTAEIAAEAR